MTKGINSAILGSIIGVAALVATAGFAFADTGIQVDTHAEGEVLQNNQSGIQVSAQAYGEDSTHVGTTGASSSEDVKDNGGDEGSEGHVIARIPRNVNSDANATATLRSDNAEHVSASSSNDNGNGFGKGGLPGFLRWLFGLPTSTTVGDIRAAATASTTVDAGSSQGLGNFFQAIFGGFAHFFGGNGN